MSQTYNIYCDESCHLEHDRQPSMALGAIWCPASHRGMLGRRIKDLKRDFGLSPELEIKWVKVSPSQVSFYRGLIDLFFDEPLLHFRGLLVPDKSILDHQRFSQDHDEFYYKMWFTLLNRLISPNDRYRIFIDIKDTRGKAKVQKLHDVLCNASYDFDRNIIESIEQVHSHQVPLLQLADVLIGALGYSRRPEQQSSAKADLLAHIKRRSGLSLAQNSLWKAEKFNLLVWRPGE